MSFGVRIQTGAYSNIDNKIFTLNTPAMREVSDVFLGETRTACSNLMVYNGQSEYAQIDKRIDDGDNIINLIVSSFTEKSLHAYIIKTRLLRQKLFQQK